MEFAVPEFTRHKDNKNLSHIPGSYGWPLIGDTFSFILKPYDVLHRHYQQYGPVFKASLTFQKFVVALGPEFIQQLMLDSKQTFSAHGLRISARRLLRRWPADEGFRRAQVSSTYHADSLQN